MSSAFTAAEAPEATAESRPGFLRTAILGEPQAIVGIVVIIAFILIGVIGPFVTGDAKTKVGTVFQHPSGSHPSVSTGAAPT